MGFSSFLCLECGHPLLPEVSADEGLNDWMNSAVVLTPRGDVIHGSYSGYGQVADCDDLLNTACLHEACWELAGEPKWDHYNRVSDFAPDQGFFFHDGDHDVIDPRIKEGREQRLQEALAAREKRRYDEKARKVYGWVKAPLWPEKAAWTQRFNYRPVREMGKVVDGLWRVEDFLNFDSWPDPIEASSPTGVEAILIATWDEFVASEECRAYLSRAEELRDEARERMLENLKSEGRYRVHRGQSKIPGDTVGDWRSGRDRYYVEDRMSFETAATFDFTGEPKHFSESGPEWDAQVEWNRAESRARRELAEAEAQRLNEQWKDQGYPVEWPT